MTVFLLIMNHMEFNLVKNHKEKCHYDNIPLDLKVIRSLFSEVRKKIPSTSV